MRNLVLCSFILFAIWNCVLTLPSRIEKRQICSNSGCSSSCDGRSCNICNNNACCSSVSCNKCVNQCSNDCNTVSCKSNCVSGCTNNCQTQSCQAQSCSQCINRCSNQCSSNECVNSCSSKCNECREEKHEHHHEHHEEREEAIIIEPPKSSNVVVNNTNNNLVNLTTHINIHNTVNNFNNISVPVYVNTTNINYINITDVETSHPAPIIYGNGSSSSNSVVPIPYPVPIFPQQQQNDNCCYVMHPKRCYTDENDNKRCYIRRHRECSDTCTSPVVTIQEDEEKTSSSSGCQYVRNYPYAYCGNYVRRDCGQCYSCNGQYNPSECFRQSECSDACRRSVPNCVPSQSGLQCY